MKIIYMLLLLLATISFAFTFTGDGQNGNTGLNGALSVSKKQLSAKFNHAVIRKIIQAVGEILPLVGHSEQLSARVGGDTDSHGCHAGAGYQWCEATRRCYRRWEEQCSRDARKLLRRRTYLQSSSIANNLGSGSENYKKLTSIDKKCFKPNSSLFPSDLYIRPQKAGLGGDECMEKCQNFVWDHPIQKVDAVCVAFYFNNSNFGKNECILYLSGKSENLPAYRKETVSDGHGKCYFLPKYDCKTQVGKDTCEQYVGYGLFTTTCTTCNEKTCCTENVLNQSFNRKSHTSQSYLESSSTPNNLGSGSNYELLSSMEGRCDSPMAKGIQSDPILGVKGDLCMDLCDKYAHQAFVCVAFYFNSHTFKQNTCILYYSHGGTGKYNKNTASAGSGRCYFMPGVLSVSDKQLSAGDRNEGNLSAKYNIEKIIQVVSEILPIVLKSKQLSASKQTKEDRIDSSSEYSMKSSLGVSKLNSFPHKCLSPNAAVPGTQFSPMEDEDPSKEQCHDACGMANDCMAFYFNHHVWSKNECILYTARDNGREYSEETAALAEGSGKCYFMEEHDCEVHVGPIECQQANRGAVRKATCVNCDATQCCTAL